MDKELKTYFDTMFNDIDPNIKLDEDQIKAIMNDSTHTLVLAGAGTGKTTTMAAKVKYLVDIKKVDPSQIVVISYTRKAIEELRDIINEKFNINVKVTTFHSLAYKYIRQLFRDRKCSIVDYNQRQDIFYDYINEKYKEGKIPDLIRYFNEVTLENKNFKYGNYFIYNYCNFENYDDFFINYKKHKMEEAKKIGIEDVINEWIDDRLESKENLITLRGELVKSPGEAIIANFLYKHGIYYSYEKIYKDVMEDRAIYKPDFTLDLAGMPLYLEYFGMNDFVYNEIKNKKINYHKNKNNKYIFIDKMPYDRIEKELDRKLKELGFVYKDRSSEEIYSQIIDNNKLSQIFALKDLFMDCIMQIKESKNRNEYNQIIANYLENDIINKRIHTAQYKWINDFYNYYSEKIYTDPDVCFFDFSDLIYYTNKYIDNKEYLKDIRYDYIIIDEYQDISDGEYTLAKKASNRYKANVFSVGDDWQSIYSFRGSNIEYITRFGNYFEKPNIMKISNTYRNPQEIVDASSEFIQRNQFQLKKDLVSTKFLNNTIHFVPYDDRINENPKLIDDSAEYKELRKLVYSIHKKAPDHTILILARNNRMIKDCFEYNKDFIDDIGTKIRIKSIKDIKLDGMTIHKAKGLTYDEVIIIGMNKLFPKDPPPSFWITGLFKPVLPPEPIAYPEERRLFYVALTRTKNNVFIFKNMNTSNRSPFVDEIEEIYKDNKESP